MRHYGIDLGTTNSLIGCTETGFLSDLIPSCVNFNTGVCGKAAYDDMEATRSFKIDMSLGTEGIKPRAASTKVLQELVRQVKDDEVKSVVISVPAYFTDNQRQATLEAAANAGLEVACLVNEPTAAAMYIAQNKKGLFAVYDLGGGTFDISIIDSRFGSYDVQATSGLVVGGDNFDDNIMKFFVKHGGISLFRLSALQRASLRHVATKYKILMQKTRKDIEVDLTPWNGEKILFTEQNYIDLMKMTFQGTINCMQKLIDTYTAGDTYEILLVGGSTLCPYLREWLGEVFGATIGELTYDPDRVVAQGAAMYAAMIANGSAVVKVSDVTRALSIGMYDGTVSRIIEPNSKIPLSVDKVFYNHEATKQLQLDLYQGESTFASENELIGQLIYDYDEVKDAMDGQVLVKIEIDQAGVIKFSCGELLRESKEVVLRRQL